MTFKDKSNNNDVRLFIQVTHLFAVCFYPGRVSLLDYHIANRLKNGDYFVEL